MTIKSSIDVADTRSFCSTKLGLLETLKTERGGGGGGEDRSECLNLSRSTVALSVRVSENYKQLYHLYLILHFSDSMRDTAGHINSSNNSSGNVEFAGLV